MAPDNDDIDLQFGVVEKNFSVIDFDGFWV